MAKLHEVLAAESTVKGQAEKCRTDLIATTFDKKKHHFGSKLVTFIPFAEGAQPVTEEQSDIQTSVQKELDWLAPIWSKALDASFQIAVANTIAKADVVLDDGTVLMEKVPATALLELEKRAGEIHALVMAIPTLDPAKGFKPDPAREDGVSIAREVKKPKTKKDVRVITLAPATPEHPAQVQLVNTDVETGTILEQEWSSLITPFEKSKMISRVEDLRRAFKTARSRANEATVTNEKIGNKIFSFVFGTK